MGHSTGPSVHAQDGGPWQQVAIKPRSRVHIGPVSPHILPDFERDVVEGPLDSVDRSIDKASAKVLRLERTLKHRSVLNPENVWNLSGELARSTSKLVRLQRRRDSLVTSIAVNQDPVRD